MTHVQLSVHEQLDGSFDRLPLGVSSRDQRQDGPGRLNDLGRRVLAVDAENARLEGQGTVVSFDNGQSLSPTLKRGCRKETDHVRLPPPSIFHLLFQQERASPSDRIRVGVRLARVSERLERKVGRI